MNAKKWPRTGPIAALLLISIFLGCGPEPATDTPAATQSPRKELAIPRFDRDSAFAYLARQLEFGPRVLGSEAHQRVKDQLAEQFREFGAQVIEQDFTANVYTGESFPATNIIARYNPDAPRRILLAAHWDSRHISDSPLLDAPIEEPVLGADDGASGVAVLLEIARQLRQNPVDLGIDLVLFDAEDYGQSGGGEASINTYALGAQYFARNLPPGPKPEYGILLDMVGGRNARFPIEGYSGQVAPQLVDKVWTLAQRMSLSNYFVKEKGGFVTDDHFFIIRDAQIPMINIINLPASSDPESSFPAHWHTPDDNLDIIDPRTLGAVGQVVLAVIYREDAGRF